MEQVAYDNVLYILMNPSKADKHESDETVNNILTFSFHDLHAQSVTITNLFPVYEPESKKLSEVLKKLEDDESIYDKTIKTNDKKIKHAMLNASVIVLAWGNATVRDTLHCETVAKVLKFIVLKNREDRVRVIKPTILTAENQPRHPGRQNLKYLVACDLLNDGEGLLLLDPTE